MAFLYKKKNSKYWYLEFRDERNRRRGKSTGLKFRDKNETAKARALCHQISAKELGRGFKTEIKTGWQFVDSFLKRKYLNAKTYQRYELTWRWLALWLAQEKIGSPSGVTYRRALDYLTWRTAQKKKSGAVVSKNTALLELRVLSLIMSEAVRMGFAEVNPVFRMGIPRDEPREKPEISDEEINLIWANLPHEPLWMQRSFAIALHTGCRLRETRIPLHCLNLEQNKITFLTPKGGRKKAFSRPIPTALLPLVKKMKEEKLDYTLEFPFQPSRQWGLFFRRLGLAHLCFHCLRVTFINRLWKAGVPREAAMRLVNHSSEMVHRVYLREKSEDVAAWRDAVQFRLPECDATAASPTSTPSSSPPARCSGNPSA